MKKIAIYSLVAVALSACGSIGNTFLSDATLQEKVAETLRTSPNNVVISERNPGSKHIAFNAEVNGKKHYCYVTTSGVNTSDAVCSEMKPRLKVDN